MKTLFYVLIFISLPCLGMARTLGLADITTTDPLGYECIDAQYFEEDNSTEASIAFSAGGKVRLPRTCLPDPCDEPLSEQELAGLTGTDRNSQRFGSEWTDYYTRYADYCRRETNPVPQDAVANGNTNGFWDGVLDGPINRDLIAVNSTPTTSGSTPSTRGTLISTPLVIAKTDTTETSGTPTKVLPIFEENDPTTMPDDTHNTGTTDDDGTDTTDIEETLDDTKISAVNLPGTLGLSFSGLIAFLLVGKRKATVI